MSCSISLTWLENSDDSMSKELKSLLLHSQHFSLKNDTVCSLFGQPEMGSSVKSPILCKCFLKKPACLRISGFFYWLGSPLDPYEKRMLEIRYNKTKAFCNVLHSIQSLDFYSLASFQLALESSITVCGCVKKYSVPMMSDVISTTEYFVHYSQIFDCAGNGNTLVINS